MAGARSGTTRREAIARAFSAIRSPRYTRIDYQTACGPAVFRVRFGNGPVLHGQVNHVRIDGQEVAGPRECSSCAQPAE